MENYWEVKSKHERLKPAVIRTNQGNVTNLSKLKQVMSSGLLLP